MGAPEDGGAMRFANQRVAWLPLPLLVAVAVTLLLRVDPGVVALLVLAALVSLGVTVVVGLSPGVVVDGTRLTVPGRETRTRRPGGTVDLSCLVRVRSVSCQGGRVSGRGLALFRNQLLLEDARGGQAMFWAWGWTPKAALQRVLRRAVTSGHARMDPMSYWRLGFRNDQGARVSPVRRFI